MDSASSKSVLKINWLWMQVKFVTLAAYGTIKPIYIMRTTTALNIYIRF